MQESRDLLPQLSIVAIVPNPLLRDRRYPNNLYGVSLKSGQLERWSGVGSVKTDKEMGKEVDQGLGEIIGGKMKRKRAQNLNGGAGHTYISLVGRV